MTRSSSHAWIREVLSNWAAWACQREGGALGYSSTNILARIGGGSRGGRGTDHVPVGVQSAETVDQAMRTLRQADGRAWLVLMLQYLGDPRVPARRRRPLSTSEAARALLVCADTAIRWRVEAEQRLIDILARSADRGRT